MKDKFKRIGLFLTISILLIACEKEDSEINIIENQWKVIYIKDNGAMFSQRTIKEYILEFVNDSTCRINLDFNECFWKYNIINEKEIIITNGICTEVCCDSEFAKELAELIGKINKYNIDGNSLFLLNKDHQIKLKKN